MANHTKKFDWIRYVALRGEPGEAWVREYKSTELRGLAAKTDQALSLLRRGEVEKAFALLHEFHNALSILQNEGLNHSICCVMFRWYHAVFAYALYLNEDYTAAKEHLRQAHRAVEEAIATEPILLPLADHCADFRFQTLRIERNRRQWNSLPGQAEDLRRLARSEKPLCVVQGQDIFIKDLSQFLLDTPGIGTDESSWLSELMSQEKRLKFIDSFLIEVFSLKGFVIPYEPAAA